MAAVRSAMGARPDTLLDALEQIFRQAAAYPAGELTPPVSVLWPDPQRAWESALPAFRQRLAVLVLGEYDPDSGRGPAIWLRCLIDGALPIPAAAGVTANATMPPIIYLPGVGRNDLRAVEDCPVAVRPLAELQYRGTIFAHANGRDWSVPALLSKVGELAGVGRIEVRSDAATGDALQRALSRLLREPPASLAAQSPLGASFFDNLLAPDVASDLLRWLDNPDSVRSGEGEEEAWAAFRHVAQERFGFDPEQDGPLAAAERLGRREGSWAGVWERFCEAPARYLNIPTRLRAARPVTFRPLLDHRSSWPQENEALEAELRAELAGLAHETPDSARRHIRHLEQAHGERRHWVWADLGQAPLAMALSHLTHLAEASEAPPGGPGLDAIVVAYAASGWQADAALLDALGAVTTPVDFAAVQIAAGTLYRPWLDALARAFQAAALAPGPGGGATYRTGSLPAADTGTCLMFVDGLRYDLAASLSRSLTKAGLVTTLEPQLGQLPGVTETAKYAQSPIASQFHAGPDLATAAWANGPELTAQGLRALLEQAGYPFLSGQDTGDPSGRAWVEVGDFDHEGHDHGTGLARHLPAILDNVQLRIATLLDAGWQQVIVFTDHGFLLVPGGLTAAALPEHLTVVRKARCARLRPDADPPGCLVVPWHWDAAVRVAVPAGIGSFRGTPEFDHGGLSPQECVLPLVTVRRESPHVALIITEVRWTGLRCRVSLAGTPPGTMIDLRSRAADPATSCAHGARPVNDQGLASLTTPDEREGEAAFVVAIDPAGQVLAQQLTTIGR